MTSDFRYRRELLEFILGSPDETSVEPASIGQLLWACGCVATPNESETYGIDPCAEHRSEFEDADAER